MSLTWGNTAATPSQPNFMRVAKALSAADTITVPSPASTQINPGDLIYFNNTTGQAALGSNAAWDTNVLTTQEDVQPWFLGVSISQKNAADPTNTPITVITRGYASYPCAALGSQQNLGTYVAAAAQGTTNLADQTVAVCANVAGTIGKTSAIAASGATELQFYFQSPVLHGPLPAA